MVMIIRGVRSIRIELSQNILHTKYEEVKIIAMIYHFLCSFLFDSRKIKKNRKERKRKQESKRSLDRWIKN